MIVTFLIYATATGEILYIGDAEDTDVPTLPGAGESYLISDGSIDYHQLDGTTSRVVGGVVVGMPASPISLDTTTILANNTATATFSSIPNPSTVSVSVPLGCTPIADTNIVDGSVIFKTDLAGEYLFYFNSYPYSPYTATITAT